MMIQVMQVVLGHGLVQVLASGVARKGTLPGSVPTPHLVLRVSVRVHSHLPASSVVGKATMLGNAQLGGKAGEGMIGGTVGQR